MTTITKQGHEFIIKDTHRGLWYEDGKLVKVLEAGRYETPRSSGGSSGCPRSSACWWTSASAT